MTISDFREHWGEESPVLQDSLGGWRCWERSPPLHISGLHLYLLHKAQNCITINRTHKMYHMHEKEPILVGTIKLSNTLSINKHGSYILTFVLQSLMKMS
jgi:hypothetical protein